MRYKSLFLVFAIVFLAGAVVSAAGVSSPYWEDNPLEMEKKQVETVILKLQNLAGEEKDITFSARIVSGEEVAELLETEFEVPFGTKGVEVPILVETPKGVDPGMEYMVSIAFTDISGGEGGTVQISSGITKSFPVVIVSSEKKFPVYLQLISLATLILLIVLIKVFMRKMKKKHPHKKFSKKKIAKKKTAKKKSSKKKKA